MNTKIFTAAAAVLILASCCGGGKQKPLSAVIEKSLDNAVEQSLVMAKSMDTLTDRLPKTIDRFGTLQTASSRWWTSGFFPGLLWYLYEYKPSPELEKYAEKITARVEREKFTTDNHDVGFMLYCSFGNGLRIKGTESYKEVLMTGAGSLATRYDSLIGLTKSWSSTDKWQFPVIIDNMMNLELFLWAFRESGDSTFYNMAVSHADNTIKHHYRPDFSTWHVVSYDTVSGQPHIKQTNQGYADDSAWARGQAWGLYGYTMMYRLTGLERYLEQAKQIAAFMIGHPNMPDDYIPYWDFNAPDQPNCYRDVSAGTIMASALVELSGYDKANSKKYLDVVEKQLRTLATPLYTATVGTNGGFILKHSVGNMPKGTEIDVPLTYADYYYVETLMRMRELLNKK